NFPLGSDDLSALQIWYPKFSNEVFREERTVRELTESISHTCSTKSKRSSRGVTPRDGLRNHRPDIMGPAVVSYRVRTKLCSMAPVQEIGRNDRPAEYDPMKDNVRLLKCFNYSICAEAMRYYGDPRMSIASSNISVLTNNPLNGLASRHKWRQEP